MFDKFEEILKKTKEALKRLKPIFNLVVILFKVILSAVLVLVLITASDLVFNQGFEFSFMQPLYNFVINLILNTNWMGIFRGFMSLIFQAIFWFIILIISVVLIFSGGFSLKSRTNFLSKPTKIRFVRILRNFLVFFVLFLAIYDLSFSEIILTFEQVIFASAALIVTLAEDFINKKRTPYFIELEKSATKVIKLSDIFEIKNTFLKTNETSLIGATVVSKNRDDFAIEYFTVHPFREKLLLSPREKLTGDEIQYFCNVLNHIKLEFEPEKFEEFQIRIFTDSELYKFSNYISYNHLSGVVRHKFFIQDLYYDIKHYFELEKRIKKKNDE